MVKLKYKYAQTKLIPDIKTNYGPLEDTGQERKEHLIGFESIGKKIQISFYSLTLLNMHLIE